MFFRVVALASFVAIIPLVRAQQAVQKNDGDWLKPSQSAVAAPDSAWLDLRQFESAHATTAGGSVLGRIGFFRARSGQGKKADTAEKHFPDSDSTT